MLECLVWVQQMGSLTELFRGSSDWDSQASSTENSNQFEGVNNGQQTRNLNGSGQKV
jgi:hypothetical protein